VRLSEGSIFSSTAIATARATELGVQVRFVEANVYNALVVLDAQYDITFVTWDRSFGYRTSAAGRISLPSSWRRTAGRTLPRDLLRYCRSTRLMVGCCPSGLGGRRHRRPLL
jgi:hypothetical protein